MYALLVRLIVLAALIELGITLKDVNECSGRECWSRLQQASQKVLRIEWKPISVFPKEAKKFREKHSSR